MKKGDTYFYQGRPVTVQRINTAFGRVQIRTSNIYPVLDFWVSVEELS